MTLASLRCRQSCPRHPVDRIIATSRPPPTQTSTSPPASPPPTVCGFRWRLDNEGKDNYKECTTFAPRTPDPPPKLPSLRPLRWRGFVFTEVKPSCYSAGRQSRIAAIPLATNVEYVDQPTRRLGMCLTNPLSLGVTKPLGNQATGHASQHYSVPVPSRGKLGGLRQKGQWGMTELVRAPIVRMGWRPDGLSVHMPRLSSRAP